MFNLNKFFDVGLANQPEVEVQNFCFFGCCTDDVTLPEPKLKG